MEANRATWLFPLGAASALIALNELTGYRGFSVTPERGLYLTLVAIAGAATALAVRFLLRRRDVARYVAHVIGVGLTGAFLYEALTNRWVPLELLSSPIFPSMNHVFDAFRQDRDLLATCTAASLAIVLTGWFLGIVAAVPAGVLLGWHRYTFRVLSPYIRIANAIPFPTWIPILIVAMPTLWWSMATLLFIGSFFAVFNQTIQGVANVDRRYIEAAQMLGASDRQTLLRVAVPSALPSILAGVQAAWILSVLLVIIAEMIGASTGLGWYLMYTRGWGEYHKVIAGMLWSGVVGLAGFEALKLLDGRLLAWRAGTLRTEATT